MAQQYFATVYGRVYGTTSSAGYTAVSFSYDFEDLESTWVIKHDLGTFRYMIELYDENYELFSAKVKSSSEDEIIIQLTEPKRGHASVVFII